MEKEKMPGRREAEDRFLFERVAATYAAKDLHPGAGLARRYRLGQTINCIPPAHLGDVLEVGCGGGFAVPYLKRPFHSYTGLDYSSELIAYAEEHFGMSGNNIAFVCDNIKRFEPEKRFDCVFMIGVLHHIEDPSFAMERCYHLLKPGGWLVMNEPQPSNLFVRLLRKWRAKVDDAYSDDQDQLSAEVLEEHFRLAGFESVQIRAQGLFSTPLAEIPLFRGRFASGISSLACYLDRLLEARCQCLLRKASWNLIASGQKCGRDRSP